jgi:hypothetical protein
VNADVTADIAADPTLDADYIECTEETEPIADPVQ